MRRSPRQKGRYVPSRLILDCSAKVTLPLLLWKSLDGVPQHGSGHALVVSLEVLFQDRLVTVADLEAFLDRYERDWHSNVGVSYSCQNR